MTFIEGANTADCQGCTGRERPLQKRPRHGGLPRWPSTSADGGGIELMFCGQSPNDRAVTETPLEDFLDSLPQFPSTVTCSVCVSRPCLWMWVPQTHTEKCEFLRVRPLYPKSRRCTRNLASHSFTCRYVVEISSPDPKKRSFHFVVVVSSSSSSPSFLTTIVYSVYWMHCGFFSNTPLI